MNPTPAFVNRLVTDSGGRWIPVQEALRGLRTSRSTFYRRKDQLTCRRQGRESQVSTASLRKLLGLRKRGAK